MDRVFLAFSHVVLTCPAPDERVGRAWLCAGGPVEDLAYIGLTILVFGVLWLIVKGVERFER